MPADPSPELKAERPVGESWFGLSARLLALTVLFVMLAEVLIYVPSVANFRKNWLNDRLAAAQVAALVLDATESLPPDLEKRLLEGVGARAVAIRGGGTRRLLAASDVPAEVARTIDLRDASWATLIRDAFMTLLWPAEQPIRVLGHAMEGADFVEIVLDQGPLRAAMLDFSRNILILSLVISGITASLVYFALQFFIVRPVRRLTGAIAAFGDEPEDVSRILAPSRRTDEIGLAERSLAQMETALADALRQKSHLAELGLAISKISHELRNMLTTAQLLTDRLGGAADPAVQRVAPRLVATLGRAIEFCQATLAYGRAAERLPKRRRVLLAPLVAELRDLTALAATAGIAFKADVPADLEVDADPDQLSRVLVNLVRNSVQALSQAGTRDGAPAVAISAKRDGRTVAIHVADNGPGVPEQAKGRLFSAFRSSGRPGGAGLGLAISAELVRLHGGTLSLEPVPAGACFRIAIPDQDARTGSPAGG
ncbi:MAG TPA: HAMP domain-containing sensor histidine kinase [Beijerinckiaceae bacterium]|jgi:signal transduction histidine kinase